MPDQEADLTLNTELQAKVIRADKSEEPPIIIKEKQPIFVRILKAIGVK